MTSFRHVRPVVLSFALCLTCLLASCGSGGTDGHDDFPVINTQPKNAVAPVGGMAGFAVSADGGRLHYSWLRNGQPVTTADDTSTYEFVVAADDQGAKYSVIVKNDAGQVTSNAAILTLSPTVAQNDFETVMLNGGEYSLRWELNPSGAQVSPNDYFSYQQTGLTSLPLGGGTIPVTIAVGNMTSTLALPPVEADRYFVNGLFVYTSAFPDLGANFSTVTGGVQFDEIGTAYNPDGSSAGNLVAYSDLRTNIGLAPLSGLLSASPVGVTNYYNVIFSDPSILASGASWQANAAYLSFTQEAVADRLSVSDCAGMPVTTGPIPSPCLVGQTSLAAVLDPGLYDSSQGIIEYGAAGTYVTINGISMWVSFAPMDSSISGTTLKYRTYAFIPSQTYNGVTYTNAIFEGTLITAGTVIAGNYSPALGAYTPYQIRLNQAAVQSLKSAVTF